MILQADSKVKFTGPHRMQKACDFLRSLPRGHVSDLGNGQLKLRHAVRLRPEPVNAATPATEVSFSHAE